MDFKKRVNGSWTDTPNYIHNTFTDTITTLPADIYPTGTTATVSLKGDMEQNGTPTPDSPITPSECGDLETVGVKAGQYKIPISSAGQTTTVYLGEVETTRKIKKLVLTGEENWTIWNENYFSSVIDKKGAINTIVCSHFINSPTGGISYSKSSISGLKIAAAAVPFITSVSELKTWLANQYAAETPITVWYVLATPETGIVNEPLRKIGDYADTVSGITIPTIAGANAIDVETTLKPSEVSVNYKGWHPVSALHRFNGTSWD